MKAIPRVLVVEDEDNIAAALEFLITREGFGHDRVAIGAEALPRIAATPPDLVLLDIMLPEVWGDEICHLIRTDPLLSNVKVLMMTVCGSPMERKRGLEIGADGFISKPFDLKNLRAAVHRLLVA